MYPAIPSQYSEAVYAPPWTNYNHGPGFRKATDTASTHHGISGARRAVGKLICKDKASITDGWVVTLVDCFAAGQSAIFEWDVAGDGITTPGAIAVNISALTTATEVATALAAAITGSPLHIVVKAQDGAVLDIQNLEPGFGTRVADANTSLAGWYGMSNEWGTGSVVGGVWESGGYDGDGCCPIRWGLCRGVAPDANHVS